MKIKDQLRNLAIAIVVIFGMYSQIAQAATCSPQDASPTVPCDNLVLTTTPSGTISIGVTVTGTASGNPALTVQSGVTSGDISIGASGTLQNLSASGTGITNAGSITSLINNGIIKAPASGGDGIFIGGTTSIGNIVNSGSIAGGRYAIHNNGSITQLTNTATSVSPTSGIYGNGTAGGDILNAGTIGTLNNAQSNTSLVLYGNLPTNYNIIINSPTSYGTFTARSTNGTSTPTGGPMTFGVFAGSIVAVKSYAGVLDGIPDTNTKIANTSGKYQGMTWSLTNSSAPTLWDLTFSGTNTSVMSALNQTTTALQNAFTLQNTVLVNGFTYDCPVFDKNNVCVSVGARTTAVNTDSVNSTGGLLIGAYRMNDQVRLGAYIDQNISTNSTGIVKVSNSSPMVGVFGVWNEHQDGTGTEVKVSAGYGQKNTTMTRPVVDGTEAGSGSSTLTSQGVQAIGKYGFAVADKTIVSPYVGLRYTQNNMGGYTEGSSATVTAPLTYSAVNTNATTVVAGLGANYKVMPDVTLLASAGLENDLSTSNGTYSATGLYGINPISFNSNPVRTRATASAGAYYDLAKNQRVSLNYIFRQEQFQGVNTNAAFLTYAIGL